MFARKIKTTNEFTVVVGRKALLEMLAKVVPYYVPTDGSADVTFLVPGGGDYSNCDVDLDDEDQVISISWREHS